MREYCKTLHEMVTSKRTEEEVQAEIERMSEEVKYHNKRS
jgi:hypothetical protein